MADHNRESRRVGVSRMAVFIVHHNSHGDGRLFPFHNPLHTDLPMDDDSPRKLVDL